MLSVEKERPVYFAPADLVSQRERPSEGKHEDAMSKRVSIIFPYMTDDPEVLQRLYITLRKVLDPSVGVHDEGMRPVLVVNKDTIREGHYDKFRRLVKKRGGFDLSTRVEVNEVWSVDTCQMWLAGFGRILDEDQKEGRAHNLSTIVQIPGDLKHISDPEGFLHQMQALSTLVQSGDLDFAVGDFRLAPQDAKHLIDAYGTYPLLFNWFPEEAAKLWGEIHLQRPRSEFFAVSVRFLKRMLQKRKFAYEQTIAFLIYALSDTERKWKVRSLELGELADYEEKRRFREATDQIERTERVLKVLWRELRGGNEFNVSEYERLDRRSTAIREAAMVYLENVLKVRESEPVSKPARRARGLTKSKIRVRAY